MRLWGTLLLTTVACLTAASSGAGAAARDAAEPPTLSWDARFGDGEDVVASRASGVSVHEGTTYAISSTRPSGTWVDPWGDEWSLPHRTTLTAVDAAGEVDWVRNLEPEAQYYERDPVRVHAGVFGVVVVTRQWYSFGLLEPTDHVALYDPHGDLVWQTADAGLEDWWLVQDAAVVGGDLYLVGNNDPDPYGDYDGKNLTWENPLLRIDLDDGSVLDQTVFRSTRALQLRQIEKFADSLVVSGTQVDDPEAENPIERVVVRRVDRRTLEPIWTTTLGTPKGTWAGNLSVFSGRIYQAVLTDGRLKGQMSSGGTDVAIVAFGQTGRRLWHRQFPEPHCGVADVIGTPRGPVLVRGVADAEESCASGAGVRVNGFDKQGAPTWALTDEEAQLAPTMAAWNFHGLRVFGDAAPDGYFLKRYRDGVPGRAASGSR